VLRRRPRALHQRVPYRSGHVKGGRQRAHRFDMGTAPFPALERADGMDRQARDRRKLLLRKACSLAERLELRPKGPRSAHCHDLGILARPYEQRTARAGAIADRPAAERLDASARILAAT
jgi:hypothetical protein